MRGGAKVFEPEELASLGSIFDESWAAVGGSLSSPEAADGRTRLASIVIGLAQLGSLGPEEIKRTAIRSFLGPRDVHIE